MEKVKMVLKDAGLGVIIGVSLVLLMTGLLSGKFLGPDNPVEENIEELLEGFAEQRLSLPKGLLDDTIDLTPSP